MLNFVEAMKGGHYIMKML